MIQIDRHTIIQVLGGLMNKPTLLSDTDKYLLEPNDFSAPLDKYVFSAIYNLYTMGAEKIQTIDVVGYLKSNSSANKLIEENNGLAFIQDCEANGEYENFNYYYNKLKKVNLVRDLQKDTTLDNIYCEDVLNDNYSEINEKFEKLTSTDIINSLKLRAANLERKYVINSVVEESNPAEGIRDLVESLKIKPEVGCRLQGDIFNTITRGGRKGKLYLRSAGTSVGKAIPNYIEIPTPNGWIMVENIKVGDYLFDRTGKPTKVLAVYPQKEKKQIYKVYFRSGRIAECCNEHLWTYYDDNNQILTSTLEEISNNDYSKFGIPICDPIEYSEKRFYMDPYAMGLLLGGGSFRQNNSNKAFFFNSKEEILVSDFCELMEYKSYKKNNGKNNNWMFEGDELGHKNIWVEDVLSAFPELFNLRSDEKFIPSEYLYGSIDQRYELLSGLMDMDGTIEEDGNIVFISSSEYLKDNMMTLCNSLGMICTYEENKKTAKPGKTYCLNIKIGNSDVNRIFKLEKKKEKLLSFNLKKENKDLIEKIEITENYVDMTCFYVDNEEHLFLMNDYICTHNTRQMVGDACHIAYPIRFDSSCGQWVSTGSCEKVLYVMTEQETEEIDTMILAYLTDINEDYFIYGTFTEEHKKRIEVAIQIMERYKDNFLYAKIPDPCSSIVKNLFRRYNLQHGVENFFYDYIFSSPAMLNEYRDLKIQEHVALRLFTTTLKNLAVELNSFIMTSTQISGDEDPKGGFRDYKNIRGSRAISDLVDFGCIMSRPTQDELNQISKFKDSFGYLPNLVIDIYKNRRGRWTQVRLWCLNMLGVCRRKDLFLTTANMKEVDGFKIMELSPADEELQKEVQELLDLYNDGLVSQNIEDHFNFLNEQPEVELLDIENAFGTMEEKKEKYGNKDSWDDLI